MSHVAVLGGGARAAEWATRWLASGRDVVVDDPTVVAAIGELWPAAQRLGLFPGADRARLRVAAAAVAVVDAAVVQLVAGEVPPGATGLVATESTARGCSPVHLVPLVEVSGRRADELAEIYRSIGMAPLLADAPAHQRWQLGDGLVQLTDGEPDALIAVMRSLRATGKGAGAAIAHHEAVRFAAGAAAAWQPGDVVAAPLALYRTPVEPEWVDYNGHMTEAAYLTAAGWASDALFRYIGDDEAYRAAGHSFYTVETHIHYVLEVNLHEPISFTTQVLGVDAKRLHLIHCMFHGDTGALLCTAEQLLVHVNMQAGRSAPILPDVAAALNAIAAAHSSLPIPSQVGSVMQLPPPRR
ncbi:MAG: thioesterase family protein [Actinomycetota bacterium]|nr:thioesterase family protein [Actinomycetota bacterium]